MASNMNLNQMAKTVADVLKDEFPNMSTEDRASYVYTFVNNKRQEQQSSYDARTLASLQQQKPVLQQTSVPMPRHPTPTVTAPRKLPVDNVSPVKKPIHPRSTGKRGPCRYGLNCKRADCYFEHSSAVPMQVPSKAVAPTNVIPPKASVFDGVQIPPLSQFPGKYCIHGIECSYELCLFVHVQRKKLPELCKQNQGFICGSLCCPYTHW